jgi:hypothetical protein
MGRGPPPGPPLPAPPPTWSTLRSVTPDDSLPRVAVRDATTAEWMRAPSHHHARGAAASAGSGAGAAPAASGARACAPGSGAGRAAAAAAAAAAATESAVAAANAAAWSGLMVEKVERWVASSMRSAAMQPTCRKTGGP